MSEFNSGKIKLMNCDCMDYMKSLPDNAFELAIVDDMQIGKAGEYLVCADLIMRGHIAYPSEQGLPYDVVADIDGRLFKVQVKTTRTHKKTPQRTGNWRTYAFNVKRCGKKNTKAHSTETCDIFALVALDERRIGYIASKEVKQTMFFRVEKYRGTYRDESINAVPSGRYLSDLKLEDALCQI